MEAERAHIKEKRKYPMSLQGYLLGLKISTLFAFSAWAGVVLYIDPESSGVFGKLLFFSTFFLWMTGALTLLMTGIQKKMLGGERAAVCLGSNMRRSIFIVCLSVILLLFQYFGVLASWNGLLVGVALLLIELYFVHHTVKNNDQENDKPKIQHQPSRLKHKRMI